MNYDALKTLIAATGECAGKSPDQVLEILNRPRAEIRVDVKDLPRSSLTRFLASRGVLSKIYDAARNVEMPHTIRSIGLAVEHVCNGGSESLDMTDAGVIAMVGALVGAGVITATDRDALTAWATRDGSLADQNLATLGTNVITLDDVRRAN